MAKKTKTTSTDAPRSKIKKELTFKLTDAQMAVVATKLATVDNELVTIDDEFTKVKTEWKTNIAVKEKEFARLIRIADTGEEKRTVECEEERDYAANAVRYYFKGTMMEERVMSSEERQGVLELTGKKQTITTKRRYPGTGKNPADFKKAASGDVDAKEDLTAVIREETNGKTKRSAVDGPTHV